MGTRRAARQVDYRSLHGGEAGSAEQLSSPPEHASGPNLHAQLLAFAHYRQGAIRRLPASQLTPHWLRQHGTVRPVLAPPPATAAAAPGNGAGMKLPPQPLDAASLAASVGPAHAVTTFDALTQQDGPTWTLHQWQLYWEGRSDLAPPPPAPAQPPPLEDEADSFPVPHRPADDLKGISPESRQRLLVMPPMPVAGTRLAEQLSPPAAVAAVDLEGAASVAVSMAPAGAYVDFTLLPAGASHWLHLLSGQLAMALIPPTSKNLAAYASWAGAGRCTGTFLPSLCEGVARVDLGPGDTLLVPPGWVHATATAAAAVTLSGSFLRADSLALHLDAWRLEQHVRVRPRQRHMDFKALMWRTAARYARSLEPRAAAAVGGDFELQAAQRAAAMREEDACLKATQREEARQAQLAAAARPRPQAGGPLGQAQQRGKRGAAGGARPKAQAASGRKRKQSPTDSFIESDDDGEGEVGEPSWGEGGEDDWAPSSSGGGGGGGAGLPLSSADEEDDDGFEDRYGGGGRASRRQRLTARQAGAVGPANGGKRGRTSTRFGGRMPAGLAAMLHEEEEEEGHGEAAMLQSEGEGGIQEVAAPVAVAATPIKLKVRLSMRSTEGGGAAGGSPAPAAAQPLAQSPARPGRLVLKLKPLPAAPPAQPGVGSAAAAPEVASPEKRIPQLDGPDDSDSVCDSPHKQHRASGGGGSSKGARASPPPPRSGSPPVQRSPGTGAEGGAELSEGEEQGLASLLGVLREWLRDPQAAPDLAPDVGDGYAVLARLELSMLALGLPLEPPQRLVDLDGAPPVSVLPTHRPQGSADSVGKQDQTASVGGSVEYQPGMGQGREEGGETSLDDVSGDDGALVAESGEAQRGPPAPARPAAAKTRPPPLLGIAKGRGGKKMSVKDRLKRKLGI